MKKNLILEIGILAIAFFLYSCSNDSSSGSGENDSIDGDWSHSGNETLYGLTFNSDGSCTGLRVDSTSSYRYYRQTCSWEASDGNLTVSLQSCERSEDGKEWISSNSCSDFTRNYFIKNSVLVLYTGDGSDDGDVLEYWVRGRSGILPDDLPQPPFEEEISSSSEKRSSSSSVKAAWQYLNPEISYGEFTDRRDGQVYKTVVIGTQTWMAENLNYDTLDGSGSSCYNNDSSYCDTYGRLYNWATAMNVDDRYNNDTLFANNSDRYQGICPSGWHVPSMGEWQTLADSLGGDTFVGAYLKAAKAWGKEANDSDPYGFSALPGGNYFYAGQVYNNMLTDGDWWTTIEYDYANAYTRGIDQGDSTLYTYSNIKTSAFSLRCVKNESSSSVAKSSSSSLVVSSSSIASSSSAVAVSYGEMTDERDGQTYKMVKIGTQTWMAENLNYADSIAMPNLKGNSWCYENSADSCAKYGRLYTWTGAMNISSIYQSGSADTVISTPQQGACPSGWHIPTDAEWTILENVVGGEETAGTYLKTTDGWYDDGNGTDTYGFSALPGGLYYGSDFSDVGVYGLWWTATEYSSTDAYFRYMYYDITIVYTLTYTKMYGRSLRCLKD